jgi:hypothetical protein
MMVSMKMAVFWVVAHRNLVEFYQHLGGTHPDDRGSKYLSNVGKLLPDYTALQPRRQPSYYYNLFFSSFPFLRTGKAN